MSVHGNLAVFTQCCVALEPAAASSREQLLDALPTWRWLSPGTMSHATAALVLRERAIWWRGSDISAAVILRWRSVAQRCGTPWHR